MDLPGSPDQVFDCFEAYDPASNQFMYLIFAHIPSSPIAWPAHYYCVITISILLHLGTIAHLSVTVSPSNIVSRNPISS